MAAGNLTLNIAVTATNMASGVISKLIPTFTGVITSLGGVTKATEGAASASTGLISSSAMGGIIGMAAGVDLAIAGLVVTMGVHAVQAAADFQTSLTSLVTGAGELQSNIAMVSQGMLQMSIDTGTSTDQLTAGMYMIESAGFHGAAGLAVLRASAEGAVVGATDLATMSNTVTSALNAYGLQGAQAAMITNELIATVAAGKMHMQDLANSLAAVLPIAAAAHISYAQVGGAIATMTMQGMSAQQVTQNLANAIRSLQAPNAQAVTEMQAMGLNANQVSMQLGQKGLTGTLQEITQAILAHMGPAGTVLQSAFRNATSAMADAKAEIAAMPKSLQGMAQQFLAGSLSTKQWGKDISGLDPITKHMMQQFATTAKQTDSFNALLTKGGPAAQTYNAALSKVMGGATGLNVALMLTGSHMTTFKNNVSAIGSAAKNGANGITGFAQVQQTMNFQMARANAAWNVFLIMMGQQLLPAVTQVAAAMVPLIQGLTTVAMWVTHNWAIMTALKVLLGILAVVIGVVVVAALVMMIAQLLILAIALAVPVAIVLGIIWVFQHWGQIMHWLQGVLGAFGGWLQGVFGAIGAWFVGLWNTVTAFFVGVWNKTIAWIHSALGGIGAWFQGLWNGIVNTAHSLWGKLVSGIRGIVTGAINWLETAWNNAVKTVVGWFQWLYNHNYYFKNLVDGIRNVVSAFVSWFENAWKTTVNNVTALWDFIKTTAQKDWAAITGAISTVVSAFTSWFQAAWNKTVANLTALWDFIKTTAQKDWAAITGAISTAVNGVSSFIRSVWGNIVSWLQGTWNTITTAVSAAWGKISSIFSTAWNTYVAPPLNNLKNSVTDFFGNLATLALTWGKNMIQGFINGIGSMAGNVKNAVSNIMGKVGSILGFHSPAKEGPGRELDVWGPNMVKGFANGIASSLPLVQDAVTRLMLSAAHTLGGTSGSASTSAGSSSFALSGARGGNSFALSGSAPIVVQVQPTSAEIHLDGRKVGTSISKYQNRAIKLEGAYRNG